ncbi:MAG: LUD domain-containing protein, partial [Desulfamplus sp.]|nr:LUD domain-containing protein [Desulfamplus sp.]
ETAEDANRIIGEIAKKTTSQKIIKSKSMTAEETHLNHHLEKEGLDVTETDLGEWIVQLRHEGPSHMVMPAIHLSRFQVAELFSDVTGRYQDAEIERLVKVARRELRGKFLEADMGITGANFVIADTGTIGIVTNEGNARLATTLPRVHVALAGIDKLLPSLKDALTVLKVLPRNATGQRLTSYVTWITGPSQCSTEPSGKREMHMVFLDNGRTRIAGDPDFAQVLQCVRCGACANVCPVYRMVGGHQLGYIYIGAIGLITTYFFHGRENAKNLVKNCTNCGACKAVCAAGIDLPRLIKEVHTRIQDEDGHPLESLILGSVLKNRKFFHGLLRAASLAQTPLTETLADGGVPYLRHLPMVFAKEHNFKRLPAIAKIPFRDGWKTIEKEFANSLKDGPDKESGFFPGKGTLKVGIFSGCVQDFVYPEQLRAGLKAMARAASGRTITLEFPMDQTCCGLPAISMGEKRAARDVAVQNVKAFESLDLDCIVTLCASCASHLKHAVPDLAGPVLGSRAREFARRVMPFSQFIYNLGGMPGRDPASPFTPKKITWHSPCHLCRGVGITREPRELLERSGHDFVPSLEAETCCGFGGSFSVNFPNVSREILTKKLDDAEATGAELVVTECPGCVMQLRGGALNQKRNFGVIHIAELL